MDGSEGQQLAIVMARTVSRCEFASMLPRKLCSVPVFLRITLGPKSSTRRSQSLIRPRVRLNRNW